MTSTVATRIPITAPWLDDQEIEAVTRILRSGWLTQGPEVAAFEREFAAYVGAPYACAVSNCTTALHLALRTLGIGPGDEVITVSHSFIATANAIRYCNATPVFVDIDPATFNINPAAIEAAVNARTRAILCVHQMGMPCEIETIVAIGRRHGLWVVEDAACASGSEVFVNGEWGRIGRPHGDVACFSFHPRKIVTTGDGGMITTSRPEWDARFRLSRQHGMSVPDTVRHSATDIVFETYESVGYNYRLTDLQAAVGRVQLRRLPETLERRRSLAARYADVLSDIPGLRLPQEPAWARTNWQSYCVRLPDSCDQRRVMRALLDQGIASKRGVMCAHRTPAYEEAPWNSGGSLRESERAEDRCIMLPLYPGMSDDDQDRVAGALRHACR
ncbi:MAG TPA: DegT/DnrJ/EryC1/StrS family aminotransferase [Vicinamibacterales bacterium]|nr:DegT/DnrJ/EryC1/StrS family aminotransferase [Vicinamibacterales bacterium]